VASEVTDMKEMRLIYCAAGFAEGTQGLWSRLRLPNDCGDLLFSSSSSCWPLTVQASLNQLKGLAVGYL